MIFRVGVMKTSVKRVFVEGFSLDPGKNRVRVLLIKAVRKLAFVAKTELAQKLGVFPQ